MIKKSNLIILVAPSGAGKSSFLSRILEEDARLRDLVTYTTRTPRANEVEGQDYFFVDEENFLQRESEGFFIETARVHGNLYGTPLDQLKRHWSEGKAVIMDVDVQGARAIRAKYLNALTIFIMPPSIDELRRRILVRSNGKPPANLELRLENARREMEQAEEFDIRVLNDEFESSYAQFKKIIEESLD